MNFAEQLRRAEQLAKSGRLVIINPPSTILFSEPNNPESFPDSPVIEGDGLKSLFESVQETRNDQPEPVPCREPKPTEEFARNWIAMMMQTTPDRVVNVEIFPSKTGPGWELFGNLKVDNPRSHIVMYG